MFFGNKQNPYFPPVYVSYKSEVPEGKTVKPLEESSVKVFVLKFPFELSLDS